MSKEEVLKYMKSAIDLETDIATQEAIIDLYQENHNHRKPTKVLLPEPTPPEAPLMLDNQASFKGNTMNGKGVGIGIIIVGIVMALLSMGLDVGSEGKGIMLIICLVVAALGFIPIVYSSKKTKKINNALESKYQAKYTRYKAELERVKEDNARITENYNRKIREWQSNDDINKEALYVPLNKTKDLLSELYSQDIIYPKYRNLPALTSMYEYFITGRCDEFAGPHGAYNLYEDEVRKDVSASSRHGI